MKISVVVPAYNEEKYLPRLLESLKNQNFPKKDYETIVVDNNSTDNTSKIARKYGTKVLFETRRGTPYARDKGVREAIGEIVIGTDADCILPCNFLKNIFSHFKSDQDLIALSGSVKILNAPLIVKILNNYFIYSALIFYFLFSKTSTCWASNFSFRKEAFYKVEGYRLDFPLLEKGIDAQSSDQNALLDKFNNIGKTLFDRNIEVKECGRRFKNRLFYWFFIEYVIGFLINRQLYRLFGNIIYIPSSFERKKPTFVENFITTGAASFFIVFLLSFLFNNFYINEKKQIVRKNNSEIKYEKIISFIDNKNREEALIFIENVIEPVRSTYFRAIPLLNSRQDDILTTGFMSS